MSNSDNAILSGIRVLDFSRVLAGPMCAMQLGDMGAEIVKVEHPERGDDSRHLKPPEAGGEAHFYLPFNRNKRSIALDLGTDEGRDVVHALAEKCDVLIENFRPGVMARLGLGYETMHERHPHLIYCSISGYGQTGPMTDRPGLDPVLQAESGLMSISGEPDGDPMRCPLAIIDTFAALYATSAVLGAILARQKTGKGQQIDIALLDSAVAILSNAAEYYFTSGENPPRLGNFHGAAVPVGLFHTRTGPFYMAMGNDRLFATLCTEVLERPDLLEDARFAHNAARVENRETLIALLEDIFADMDRDEFLARTRQAGLAAGAVRSVSEAVESEEITAREMVMTVAHPTAGKLRIPGSPLNFSETPIVEPTPPPLLGQHTEEILREVLGYDDDGIAALRATKTIP
jgi:crotonobetainyl-CoA:carnitine CoA-transferase CaiB-like acyl-CoA transferase